MTVALNPFTPLSAVQMADVIYFGNGVDNVRMTDGLVSGASIFTMSTVAPTKGTFAAAETDDGVGELDGTYYYAVTFVRAASSTYPFMESGPSELDVVKVSILSGPSNVSLTNIPQSTDTQIDKIRIYRMGGSLNTYRLVAEIDHGTTSYKDETSEDDLRAVSTLLRLSDDSFPLKRTYAEGLPPKCSRLAVWENRLWGIADDDLVWSEPKPWHEDWPSRNSKPIPVARGVSEKGTGLATHKGSLYVWTEDVVYLVVRSGDYFTMLPVCQNRGTPAGGSIISVGDNLYWLNRQVGPVMWAGSGEALPVGAALRDFWRRVDKNSLWRAAVEYQQERFMVCWYVTEGRYDVNNRRIRMDVVGGDWNIDHVFAPAVGSVRNELGEMGVIEGNVLGDLFHFDLGTGDVAGATGTTTGPQGNLTAGGVTLVDDGAAFDTNGDEIEGGILYLFDSAWELLQVNAVVTVDSATQLTTMYPIPANVAHYTIGGMPFIWESSWLKTDNNGPDVLRKVEIEYLKGSGATVYVDYKVPGDTSFTNIGSFTDDGDGREEMYTRSRAEFHKIRIRCQDRGYEIKVNRLEISLIPTGGK